MKIDLTKKELELIRARLRRLCTDDATSNERANSIVAKIDKRLAPAKKPAAKKTAKAKPRGRVVSGVPRRSRSR